MQNTYTYYLGSLLCPALLCSALLCSARPIPSNALTLITTTAPSGVNSVPFARRPALCVELYIKFKRNEFTYIDHLIFVP